MLLGYSQCHFPHRNMIENIKYAKANGFGFLEGYAPDVLSAISENADAVTEALRSTGLGMTVHHGLVNPENEESAKQFRNSLVQIHDWVKNGSPLNILSFDTWVDRGKSFPLLMEALELFSDTTVKILTEDCPVNEAQYTLWQEAAFYPNYGLLLDLGHMNVRLADTGDQKTWCLRHEGDSFPSPRGDHSPEAFYHALKNKKLPIVQLHVHNNDGKRDMHSPIYDGTADYKGIVRALKRIGFDGWVDLEFSPIAMEKFGDEADALLKTEAEVWNKIWNESETDL